MSRPLPTQIGEIGEIGEAGSPRAAGERSSIRLEALLRDLGHELRRASAAAPTRAARLPTGEPELDALLEGGLPCGRLSEIAAEMRLSYKTIATDCATTKHWRCSKPACHRWQA